MTKSELIARLAARHPQLGTKDAELAVKVILDAMAKSLSQGQRIEIRGFGSFDLNYRPPRVGRKGLQDVLEIIQREPRRAKDDLKLSRFVDESTLDELEKEGFFKTLTKNVSIK